VLSAGSTKANELANRTLAEAKESMGL
jgi:hypothetical protein